MSDAMLPLETERLTLRMLREADLDAYAAMLGDAEVMRYIGDGKPMSRPDAWRSIATMLGHWQLRGYGMLAAVERASGELVGRIGFWNPEGWPGFEVGWILRRAFWGRGYAAEGARAVVKYAFTELQQPQIISVIRPENAASIRVAERIGERLDRRAEIMGNPQLIYGLRREDWAAG
jgi:RimJ/RimL family protein N-acetyltransferase